MASSPGGKPAARSLALRSALWLGLAAGIVVVAIRYGADRVTGYASIGALIVAMSPFARPIKDWWERQVAPSTADQAAEAAQLLRKLVADKWQPNAEFLQIGRIEETMAVAWRDAGGGPQGSISTLIDGYRDAPRPLIVLGDQGSGKSALSILLLLALLADGRSDDARIPVLLRLSSWDADLGFEAWLTRAVYEQYDIYRQLRDTSRYGSDVVASLLTDGHLLPILDGLDELPPEAARQVIGQVRTARIFTEPFVLTSRIAEYEYAVDRKPPRGVRTVRLLPLSPASVADYVRNLFSGDLERWQPVLDELASDPDGIVATTLSSPLMLYLGCTHFYDSGTDPAALLDRDAHRTAQQLQHYLLDSFVPAVFRDRAAAHGPDAVREPWRLGADRARSTLSYLARYLEERRGAAGSGGAHGARDLQWWDLYRQVPKYVIILTPMVIGTLGCGLLGRVAFGLFGRAGVGTVFGLAIGCVGGFVLSVLRPRPPVQFVPRSLRQQTGSRQLLLMDAALGVLGAVAGVVINGLIASPLDGVFSGLICGLTFALVRRFTRPTEPRRGISPLAALRADRTAVLYAILLGALVGAAIGGFEGLTSPQLAARLVYRVGRPERGLIGAAVGAVLGSGGLGMMTMATSSWSHYVLARGWLALTGRTPHRLLRFLEDCCELGVLRRVGAGYQFRHVLLQELLARGEGGGSR